MTVRELITALVGDGIGMDETVKIRMFNEDRNYTAPLLTVRALATVDDDGAGVTIYAEEEGKAS